MMAGTLCQMQMVWKKYMEKLLNVENEWDGEVGCPEVLCPCLISEEEIATAIIELKLGMQFVLLVS